MEGHAFRVVTLEGHAVYSDIHRICFVFYERFFSLLYFESKSNLTLNLQSELAACDEELNKYKDNDPKRYEAMGEC
jgi:hypothetical protein